MSFPRYSRYKESGVEWVGEVPEHWEVGSLTRFARMKTGHTPSRQVPKYWENCSIPWFGLADVWQLRDDTQKYLGETAEKISQLGLNNSAAELLPAGTVVLSRTASVGYSGIMPVPMATTQDFWNWICGPRLIPEFLLMLFRAMRSEFQRLTMGSTHKTIYQPDAASLKVGVPPLDEQRKIVAILDQETLGIEELINEQQRLIELLKEKRQAVISHAVTKGLNPEAPMKPSGVEWLGDVPAHWEVGSLKRFCRQITDGAHISPETENGIYPFISTRDVGEASIDFTNCLRTSASSFAYLVRNGCRPESGDVLFSKDGTIGRTIVIRDERDFVVASSLIIIRPEQKVLDSQFLHRLCQSRAIFLQVDAFVKGAGLPRLSIQNLRRVLGCVPPLNEQREIVRFVEDESARYEGLVVEAWRAIALLQERRAALISAAVTGKIDVRAIAAGAA